VCNRLLNVLQFSGYCVIDYARTVIDYMRNFLKKKTLANISLDRKAMMYNIIEYETKNSDLSEKKKDYNQLKY